MVMKVSTTPIGIENSLHGATSFGSNPCLSDKTQLQFPKSFKYIYIYIYIYLFNIYIYIYMSTPAAKLVATFARHVCADASVQIHRPTTERKARSGRNSM